MASTVPRGSPSRHFRLITVLHLLSLVVNVTARVGRTSSAYCFLQAGRSLMHSVGTTTAVLKTYGNWTPWIDFLVERYSRQLASAGVQLHILRDVSLLEPNKTSVRVSNYSHRGGKVVAPLCEVTWWAAAEHLAGRKNLLDNKSHSWTADAHLLTTVYELLWWEQCAPQLQKRGRHYVWFLEQDAFFNGDLARFVKAYQGEDADYMARGFRIAGPQWWLYSQFADGFKSGLKNFSVNDDLVKNVWPLPEMAEGKCNQTIPGKHGLLFAQDHVTRYSSRFLRMLGVAAARGVIGPGEGLKATLCASGLGLDKGEVCSMRDFAPIREPSRSNATSENWISPVYCWVQVAPEPGRPDPYDSEDLPCSRAWLDKWVHPVKMSSPGLRLQEC